MAGRRLTLFAVPLFLLAACLAATAAPAAASPFSVSNPLQRAVPAAPASASAMAQALTQQTGVDPALLTVQNSCADATPGHAACDAQVLVLKSTHRPVRPRALGHGTRAQPALAGAPAPATEPTGQAAPSPYTPQFLQQAYDLTYLSAQNGAGDTVAIVDAYDDPNAASDLAAYRARYGLPVCAAGCFQKVNQSGGSSPLPPNDSGWEEEESLDLDAVSALCPNCHILLVEATSNGWSDLNAAVQEADTLGANQISMSFSGNVAPGGTWTFTGVSSLAATGDHGYPGAGINDYPAAYAGVTAVGGTSLTAATNSRGFGESAWSLSSGWGGGSGCDTTQPQPSFQTGGACIGRAYSDMSADADPNTGLGIYDSGNGGWLLMGGTSLATPLTAAFEAVTGIDGSSPQWAYADSGFLNDVLSGSTGSCAANIAYICNAGVGYDGPSGNGSISGDVAPGAPLPGGAYATAVQPGDATVNGGVYSNRRDTTYYWEYGTTTSYGHQTSPVDIGAGTAAVSVQALLTNLTPQAIYHYRLVATNALATSYGYDYTFTTPYGNPPAELAAPSVQGTPQPGQALTLVPGLWNPSGTMSYQWQDAAAGSGTFVNLTGATAVTYSPDTSLVGDQLQVVLTVTNADGISTAIVPAGTVQPATAPVNSSPPTVNGRVNQASILTATTGTWGPSGTIAYQWQEASTANGSFSDIGGATAAQYTPTSGDLGQFLRVQVTETDGIAPTTVSSAAVGPVGAPLPVNTIAPSVNGTFTEGQTLSADPGQWNPAGSVTYEWQRYAGGWQDIPGATTATYLLTASDAQTEVRVMVIETSSGGSTQAVSAPTSTISPLAAPSNPVAPSPVPPGTGTPPPAGASTAPAPPDPTQPGPASGPAVSGRAAVGGEVKVSMGGEVQSVQFFRCAQRCVPVGAPGRNAYRLVAADQGQYIRARLRLSTGRTVWTTRMLGPVSSANAGSVSLPRGGAVTVVRALGGRSLAIARVVKANGRTLTLTVTAQGDGPLTVWACSVGQGGTPTCTPGHAVRGRLELSLQLDNGNAVQLVAVRRR